MTIPKKLRDAYVESDNLYEFQRKNFKSFSAYKGWLSNNTDATELLEEERMYRVIQAALSGLVEASAKGSAAASVQLKSLTGLSRPVGRPKGSGNISEETRLNQLLRDISDYDKDVERLKSI